MPDLYLLFNHRLSEPQAVQAREQLGVENVVVPPPDISRLWGRVPPEPESIAAFLRPVFSWLDDTVSEGDFVLVQGDFGACYLALEHLRGSGVTPVYATTRRQAIEQPLDDGGVRLTHTFRHVRFRVYGR